MLGQNGVGPLGRIRAGRKGPARFGSELSYVANSTRLGRPRKLNAGLGGIGGILQFRAELDDAERNATTSRTAWFNSGRFRAELGETWRFRAVQDETGRHRTEQDGQGGAMMISMWARK